MDSAPENVVFYAEEIHGHQRKKEMAHQPNPRYMQNIQTDINENCRVILIDWLVDVHRKSKLLDETLFLTINIIDRYLSK